MFAGLIGLECHSNSLFHLCEVKEGGTGRTSGSVGSTSRKRYKRPGYMRGERQPDNSHDEDEEEEEEEGCGVLRNGKSGRHASNANDATNMKNTMNQANQLSNSVLHKNMFSSPISTHSTMNCNGTLNNMNSPILKSDKTIPKSPSSENPFNSSFSFIQQSLNCSQDFNTAPEPLNDTMMIASLSIDQSNHQNHVYSLPSEKEDHKFWRDGLWSPKRGGVTGSDLPDIDARSVDTEITSSLSVDSDTASASSVTSGYESATPVSTEQGWESLVKKYDGVLHECLQNNRTHTKIESMMLKLQRLQQKAIQEDDYDAAERFGKKLEELCRERGALRLGLPSRQPTVAQFLQRLSLVVNGALQRTECAAQHRETTVSEGAEPSELSQDPVHRRDRLIQEKRLVEMEMAELQQRLSALEQRRQSLEEQIQDQETASEGLETLVLKTYSPPQLQDLHQILQDLLSSQDRSLISVSPPPSVLRLQEQEQASNLSIKEATAKVVMSQRLGSSLRRRVSETETQLLALQEAKLAAISGNDFGSAKELKAEMRAVNQERERLEGLTRRLQTLSSSSSEELRRLKEQRGQLRQERESRQAQHEIQLKDNATKYMELLEDRLQSYGCPGLERIWEADLEACHLFLRGLQLRTASISGSENPVPSNLSTPTPPGIKEDEEEEEEDCAMLTALGGRWCPEANLQNSEFTKKLEEFLFCVEDNAPEDGCSEAGGADLTEQCELISDRLMTLEEELQMAIHNRDQALTQSLEKEVQNVKATLQSMLAQLQKDEEEEDDEINKLEDDDLMENGLEEEEDQYFSDSWDI